MPRAEGSEWGYGIVEVEANPVIPEEGGVSQPDLDVLQGGIEAAALERLRLAPALGIEALEEVGAAPIQTPEERALWAADEAVRIDTAARRSVHFGRDPRDARPSDIRPNKQPSEVKPETAQNPPKKLTDVELAARPFGRGKGTARTSAEVRAEADQILREHNRSRRRRMSA